MIKSIITSNVNDIVNLMNKGYKLHSMVSSVMNDGETVYTAIIEG